MREMMAEEMEMAKNGIFKRTSDEDLIKQFYDCEYCLVIYA